MANGKFRIVSQERRIDGSKSLWVKDLWSGRPIKVMPLLASGYGIYATLLGHDQTLDVSFADRNGIGPTRYRRTPTSQHQDLATSAPILRHPVQTPENQAFR